MIQAALFPVGATRPIVTQAEIARRLAKMERTAGTLGAGAVNGANIAAGTITAGHIVAGAITTGAILAGSITTELLAAGAITAEKIAANTITAAQIAGNTITANEIAAAAITTNELAAGSVTAGKIAANTITAGQIAAGAITTVELAAGAITTDKLAANAVTAAKIAAGTITATEIAATSITGAVIAAGTITATNIATGTLTGTLLAANTITGDKIVTGTITATQISVTSLSSLSANLGTITAGTITGALFRSSSSGARFEADAAGIRGLDAAGVITFNLDTATGKITTLAGVGGGNLATNYSGEDPTDTAGVWGSGVKGWLRSGTGSDVARITTAALLHPNTSAVIGVRRNASTGTAELVEDVPRPGVQPGDTIAASMWVRPAAGAGLRQFRIAIQWFDSAGTSISTTNGPTADEVAGAYTRVKNEQAVAPAGAASFRLRPQVLAATTLEEHYIAAIQAERGGIVTAAARKPGELYRDQVTAVEVAPAAVTGTELANAAVSNVHIVAGTITGDRLLANTITAGQIAAGAITATQIAANTITGGNIAAGTITGANILAGSVNADRLVAASITAGLLAANAVTATTIAAGAIDGKTITGATVQTAASGSRVVLDSAGIKAYNAGIETLAIASSDGSSSLTIPDLATTAGVPQLANPSADVDLSSWTVAGVTRTTTAGQYDTAPGAFAVAVGGGMTSDTIVGTFAAGKRYALRIRARQQSAGKNAQGPRITIYRASGGAGIVKYLPEHQFDTTFRTYTVEFTPPADWNDAKVDFNGNADVVGYFVDTLDLIDVDAPTVRQFALKGSGGNVRGAVYGWKDSGINNAHAVLEAAPDPSVTTRRSSARLAVKAAGAAEYGSLRVVHDPSLVYGKDRVVAQVPMEFTNDDGAYYVPEMVLMDSAGESSFLRLWTPELAAADLPPDLLVSTYGGSEATLSTTSYTDFHSVILGGGGGWHTVPGDATYLVIATLLVRGTTADDTVVRARLLADTQTGDPRADFEFAVGFAQRLYWNSGLVKLAGYTTITLLGAVNVYQGVPLIVKVQAALANTGIPNAAAGGGGSSHNQIAYARIA